MVRADVFLRVLLRFWAVRLRRLSEFSRGNFLVHGFTGTKAVRTNSRILYQKEKIKEFWFASCLQFSMWCSGWDSSSPKILHIPRQARDRQNFSSRARVFKKAKQFAFLKYPSSSTQHTIQVHILDVYLDWCSGWDSNPHEVSLNRF